MTGSSSCLAQALLPQLCQRADISEVLGVDVAAARFKNPKYRHIQADICEKSFADEMSGADAVIHLAYAVMRGRRTDDELRRNNVDGTLNVFEHARQRGVSKVINLSSVSVYGQGQSLTEESPLKPSKLFTYAQHKAEIEQAAAELYPSVVHLRSHLIFGRNAQRFLRDMACAPVVIVPRKPWPVLQVVHEADVARAVSASLDRPVSGPFNLAASDIVSLPELVRYRRRGVLPLPLPVVKAGVAAAKWFGSRDEFTWLEVIDTTLTVDCRKAEERLGWVPRHSAWEACSDMRLVGP